MPRPDEGMIHAWLDGELTAEEAARVAKLAAEDPEWGAAVAEARGLVAASTRIVSALDVVPAGVMPAGSRAAGGAATTPRSTVRPWMRMAAGVVLVVGTATVVWTRTADAPQPTDARIIPAEQVNAGAAPAPAPTTTAGTALAEASSVAPKATSGAPVNTPAGAPARAPSASGAVDAAARSRADDEVVSAAREVARDAAPEATREAKPVAARQDASAKVAAEALERRANEAAKSTVVGALGQVSGGAAQRAEAQRAAAPAAQPGLRALREADAGVAADALGNTLQLLAGCWKAVVAGYADTVLVDPRIARQAGDTLVLVVAADGRTATVRRVADDTVRGETRFGPAAAITFVGTRTACPRAP